MLVRVSQTELQSTEGIGAVSLFINQIAVDKHDEDAKTLN
jgi:hypothetical protein